MVELKLLSMPGCSHCAAARKIIAKLKKEFPKMKYKEVDVSKHPEESQKYGLMSAPGIVINGKLEFSGGASEDQLRKKLKGK